MPWEQGLTRQWADWLRFRYQRSALATPQVTPSV